jgi:hypothetical protein
MIDARRLLVWGDREDRRRRRARPGPAGWHPLLWSALAGLGLGAEVLRSLGVLGDAARGDATFVGASRLWLAVLIAGHTLVIFGAPFRMFWRRDAALLGRLPLRGAPLFAVALIRTARATAVAQLPLIIAALAFGPWLAWEASVRHLILAAVVALWGALLAPSAALAAGAVVASDKAEALLASMGGEFRAPKTSWLGVLPGLVATGMALLAIACADWIVGAEGTAIGAPLPVLVAAAVIPVVAIAWAARAADRIMLEATREVAALDQERLAHVERTRPTAVDRAVMGRLAPAARLVYGKDARLQRRRYPMPYFLGVVGVGVLWIVAAVRPDDLLVWAAAITGCLAAYGVIMARRLVTPPTELAGMLRTLPLGPAAPRAKRVHALSWLVVYPLLGAIPCAVRAHQPLVATVVLGLVLAVAAIAATSAAGRDG